jgi:hypothetical protein
MKNLESMLAENMRRFNTKNLTEQAAAAAPTKVAKDFTGEGSTYLTSNLLANGNSKIDPALRVDSKLILKPANILKYSPTMGLFVGKSTANNSIVAMFGSPGPQSFDGAFTDLSLSPQVNPTGWNEFQWIKYIDQQNNKNSLTVDGVSMFLANLAKVGVAVKFGTITPQSLSAAKIQADKLQNLYIPAIAKAGINQNFKTV